MEGLDEAGTEALRDASILRPAAFSGINYPTEISTVQVTGAPELVGRVGSLLKPLLGFENDATPVEIKLQRTEDRGTGELTDNYALCASRG